MAIIDIQRRLREIGRIRIGETKVSAKGKKYPAKLDKFRLTSQDRDVIDAAAGVYGGKLQAWEDSPGAADQWQLYTNTAVLEVVVPPTGMAFSQFYETWTAGGCVKRCDGRWDTVNDAACSCDPQARECAAHTRLSVILPALPGLGVWRLDTSGWYAATELGGVVEICQAYAQRGQMLPARLRLEQRTSTRIIDGKSETRHYAVPVLDVDLAIGALGLGGRGVDEVTGEISATSPRFTPVPAELEGPKASIAEQVSAPALVTKPRKNAQAAIPATGRRPRTAAEVADDELPSSSEPKGIASRARAVKANDPIGEDAYLAMKARVDALDAEHLDIVKKAMHGKKLVIRAESPKADADAADKLLKVVEAQQKEVWDRRRRHAFAALAPLGLDDDARHQFISDATDGATASSAQLTEEQLQLVLDAAGSNTEAAS